jgi:hypothetical protein
LAGHDDDSYIAPVALLLLSRLLDQGHAIRADTYDAPFKDSDQLTLVLLDLRSRQGPLKIVRHLLLDLV